MNDTRHKPKRTWAEGLHVFFLDSKEMSIHKAAAWASSPWAVESSGLGMLFKPLPVQHLWTLKGVRKGDGKASTWSFRHTPAWTEGQKFLLLWKEAELWKEAPCRSPNWRSPLDSRRFYRLLPLLFWNNLQCRRHHQHHFYLATPLHPSGPQFTCHFLQQPSPSSPTPAPSQNKCKYFHLWLCLWCFVTK